MFTDNKKETTTGSQLVDNTNSVPVEQNNDAVGSIYTMPNAGAVTKPAKAKSSPMLMVVIAVIVVIAITAVGFWFYNTMSVPIEDNLLFDSSLNEGSLIPPDNLSDEEESDETEEVVSLPSNRDQQRLDDVTAVRSALAGYYQEMKAYPDILDDLLEKYLDFIPINPNPGGSVYIYVPQDSNQAYKLSFTLEEGAEIGVLKLLAGEYIASAALIEPLVEGGNEDDDLDVGDDDGLELLSGLDSDSDGLTDIEENLYETSSTLVDSDEDGYSDASELTSLYDPSQPATLLADVDTVTQYINTTYNYSVLYPSEWTVRALTEDKMEIIFNSKTTEFIQILVLENPLGLSARNWYLNYDTDVNPDTLKEIVLNNIVGVQTGSDRYTYLGVGSNIYSIIYNVGTTNQLNYQATYEMMLNSWELITINEGSLSDDRDVQRLQDVTDIRFALLEYQVANLALPEFVDNDVDSYQMIGTAIEDCAYMCGNISTSSQCVDISTSLVPDYLVGIPFDPLDGTVEMSGYYLNLLTDGTLIAGACQGEVEELIEVSN